MFCAGCQKSFRLKELKRCGSCNVAHYCGVKCQKADWSTHKRHCKDLKKFLDEATFIWEYKLVYANEDENGAKFELEDMRAWMAQDSWPTESEVLNWIRYQLQANLKVFSCSHETPENISSQLNKYDHYLASEIYYGLMSPGPTPFKIHFGNVRRIGWIIYERFGFEGMQWYFIIFMNMIRNSFAFPKLTYGSVSGCVFKINLERIWHEVGDWSYYWKNYQLFSIFLLKRKI